MTNAIRIDYRGMRPYLQEAVIKVNELLRTQEFYDNICHHQGFDMADISPISIAHLMRNANIDMGIDLYYAMSPLKDIDGFDDFEQPSLIHINIWKINRPVASICNTLLHGCVHAVNARNDQYHFGHGDTSATGKENTAPYWIGNIAQRMVSKEEKPFIYQLEHDVFKYSQKPAIDYFRSVQLAS